MNSTDRYAFIALMFLIVIVAVAAFWDDGGDVNAAERDSSGAAATEVDSNTAGRDAKSRDRGDDLPIGGFDGIKGDHGKVSTRGQNNANHSVSPVRDVPPSRVELPEREQRGDVPANTLKPLPRRGRDGAVIALADDNANSGRAKNDPFLKRPSDAAGKPSTGTRQPKTNVTTRETPPKTSKPKPKSDPKGAASDRIYVVKSGDALSSIAERECGSKTAIDEIVRLNGITDRHTIIIGAKLRLPARNVAVASTSDSTVEKAVNSNPSAKGRKTVTIASGEMLGQVLIRELGTSARSIALVKTLNPGIDVDNVDIGQVIVLPRLDEIPGGTTKTKSARPAAVEEPRLASSGKKRPARKGNYVR